MCRHVCLCLCMYVCVYVALEVRIGYQIPLELELHLVLSSQEWILGVELRSSMRATRALNHLTISPFPVCFFELCHSPGWPVTHCVVKASLLKAVLLRLQGDHWSQLNGHFVPILSLSSVFSAWMFINVTALMVAFHGFRHEYSQGLPTIREG